MCEPSSSIYGKQQTNLTVCLASLLCVFLLWLKIPSPDFISNSLFEEDGNIFLSEAFQYGWHSLLIPYAGYLHIYPRLVSLIAVNLAPSWIPAFMFTGWIFAYLTMVYVVVSRSIVLGISTISSAILVSLITIQPNEGEVFFCVTNSQWILGIALLFYSLAPNQGRLSIPQNLFLIVSSLSGPFSLFALIIIGFRLLVLKDFYSRWRVYCLIGLGSLLQALVIIFSSREILHMASDGTLVDWIKVIGKFFLFADNSIFQIVSSLIFWVAFLYFMQRHTKTAKTSFERLMPIFLLLLIGLILTAGLFSHRQFIRLIGPLQGASRYFFIPYAMLFFITIYETKNSLKHQIPVTLLLIALCAHVFVNVERPNLQYPAYAKYAQIKPDITIPIAPQNLIKGRTGFALNGVLGGGQKNIDTTISSCNFTLLEQNPSSYILSSPSAFCPFGEYVGIELGVSEIDGKAIKLTWKDNSKDVWKSLPVTLPPKSSFLHYAFKIPLNLGEVSVSSESPLKITSCEITCMK